MTMGIIKQLFFCYWNLSLLKNSPENTPYSMPLLVFSAVLLSVLLSIQWSYSSFVFADDLLLVFCASVSLVCSYFIYTAAILFFKNLKARLVQTLTSLLFTQSVVHVLAMPLFIIDPYLTQNNLKNPVFLFIAVLYLFATIGFSIWQFIITAHIYKYALNTTPVQSVFAAFGLIAVNILTLSFW